MTPAQLYRISGIPEGTISRYRKSVHAPMMDKLGILAKSLGCSVDDLVGQSEKKEAPAADRKDLPLTPQQRWVVDAKLLPEVKRAELVLHLQDMLAKQDEQMPRDSQG